MTSSAEFQLSYLGQIGVQDRKTTVYCSRQTALFGKRFVRLLPICRRLRQRVRQGVSPSAIKRDTHCFSNLGLGQGSGMNQENHVHQVPHATIRRTMSWQSIGVKFFGKLSRLFVRSVSATAANEPVVVVPGNVTEQTPDTI